MITMTVRIDDLTHRVVDLDKKKRNGRTVCGSYIHVNKKQMRHNQLVTCLRCLVNCTCGRLMESFGPAFLPEVHGHDPDCASVGGEELPGERDGRIIMACVQDGEHLANVDGDGFCEACGYQ